MNPTTCQNRHLPQRPPSRSQCYSLADATSSSPPSRKMAGITSRHVDWHPSSLDSDRRQNNAISSHYVNHKQHPPQQQVERCRPDPPEYLRAKQPLQYPWERRHSEPTQLSSKVKVLQRRQRHANANLMLPSHKHKQKSKNEKRYEPHSHKQKPDHQHRDHEEYERIKSAREHVTIKRVEIPYQQKPHESPRTKSERCRVEELDDYDQQHRHFHPAKSSSFQSNPQQLLQVYEDLRLRQNQLQLEAMTNQKQDANNHDGNAGVDVNRRSGENHKIESLAKSSGSNKSSITDIYRERNRQPSTSQNNVSENDCADSFIDGSGVNSLTVLRDEDSSHKTSQCGNSMVITKASPTKCVKKGYLKTGSFCGQGSIDGGNTTEATTSISTTSEEMAVPTSGIHAETQGELAQNHSVVIPTYLSNNKHDDDADDVVDTAPAKTREKSRPRGRIVDLAKDCPNIPSLESSIKFPTCTSINNQLLQKQIMHLQHEIAGTSSKSTNQDSQVIIYPHHRDITAQKAIYIHMENLRRRGIIHKRNGTRKSVISPDRDNGRRWSFS